MPAGDQGRYRGALLDLIDWSSPPWRLQLAESSACSWQQTLLRTSGAGRLSWNSPGFSDMMIYPCPIKRGSSKPRGSGRFRLLLLCRRHDVEPGSALRLSHRLERKQHLGRPDGVCERAASDLLEALQTIVDCVAVHVQRRGRCVDRLSAGQPR